MNSFVVAISFLIFSDVTVTSLSDFDCTQCPKGRGDGISFNRLLQLHSAIIS